MERISRRAAMQRSQRLSGLCYNGISERPSIILVLLLLVPASAHAFRPRAVSDLRFENPILGANEQRGVTVPAGEQGYLAAWFEAGRQTTVRASRIDNEGHYLDAEGIVLSTLSTPPTRRTGPYDEIRTIAADTDGKDWLIVWGYGAAVQATRLSEAGEKLDAVPIPIGKGYDVAVRWSGANYIALHADDGSLYSTTITSDGRATSQRLLMAAEIGPPIGHWREIRYHRPAIAAADTNVLTTFRRTDANCVSSAGSMFSAPANGRCMGFGWIRSEGRSMRHSPSRKPRRGSGIRSPPTARVI